MCFDSERHAFEGFCVPDLVSVRTEKGDHEEEGGRENKEKLELGGENQTKTHFNAIKSSLAGCVLAECALVESLYYSSVPSEMCV